MAITGLRVRKLAADDSAEDARKASPRDARPFGGLQIEGDAPKETRVPTSWVARGQAEGWIEVDNPQMVVRPAGPAHAPMTTSHVFMHADAIILKTTDGDVRYRVTHQPDKYVDGGKDTDKVTTEHYAAGNTRVDHFFDLKLEGGKD
jgi:hypothetical protein